MLNDLWINLPVKDVAKSKAFFTALGFTFNTQHGNSATSASMLVGKKNVVVMLFDEPTFKGFTGNTITDTAQSTEVLLSIGVESKEEVDALAEKAKTAGGTCNHQPNEMKGWMYGCVFADIDGHRWNVLYMDMSKMA